MSDLIDKDELRKKWIWGSTDRTTKVKCIELCDLDDAPTVDAEPIRHGKWIYIDDGDERYATYRCSHCHQEVTVDAERICDIGFVIEDLKYCPNCGARMGVRENEQAQETEDRLYSHS